MQHKFRQPFLIYKISLNHFNKGILTEKEYRTKVEKIETEKTEQNLKNSMEYKQLKSLFDSGILTKEEFENKIQLLQSVSEKEVEIIEKSEGKKVDNYSINEPTTLKTYFLAFLGLITFWIIMFLLTKR